MFGTFAKMGFESDPSLTSETLNQEYRRLLARNPFGPENLYSSSCLRSFVGAEGEVCLAHTDYSRAVKIRTLRRSVQSICFPIPYVFLPVGISCSLDTALNFSLYMECMSVFCIQIT